MGQSLVPHAMHGLRCWWETSPSSTASGKLWLNCTTVVLTEHLTMCTCRLWLDGGLDVSVHRTEGIVSSISRVTCCCCCLGFLFSVQSGTSTLLSRFSEVAVAVLLLLAADVS